MKTSRRLGISAVFIGLVAPAALAQSVYIDFAVDLAPSPPSSSYAAAATAPGHWNVGLIPSSLVPLAGLSGEPTALRFSAQDCDSNTGLGDTFPTTGDDAALLDDWFYGDCFATKTKVTIHGVAPGDYRLYLYPKADGSGFVFAEVDVSPPQGQDATLGWPAHGPFPGTYSGWQIGLALIHVAAPNSTLSIQFQSTSSSGISGMQLELFLPPSATGATYCFGDGSGALCPCFNDGFIGHGCANLIYSQGARLTASGTASVSADTLVLSATQMSGAFSWYFQATAQAQDPLGYGILCVGGSLLRIGQKALTNGASTNPSGVDFPISVKGAIPPAGGTRHYQVSYRQANPPCSPTPTTNTNRTNGLTIVWTP